MSNQYTDTQYQWLCEAIRNHNSDECLLWPFTVGSDGYAHIVYEGRRQLAHRVAFKIVNGHFPKPCGLHSDKCTSRACINPQHIREGTQQENVADRVRLGRNGPRTALRGQNNPWARFTDSSIMAIRRLCADGVSMGVLAKAFDCEMSVISNIVHGKRWKHLPVFPEGQRAAPSVSHRIGEGNGNSKLTAEQVHDIRKALAKGIPRRDLATYFRVDRTTIGRIHRGERWYEKVPVTASTAKTVTGDS